MLIREAEFRGATWTAAPGSFDGVENDMHHLNILHEMVPYAAAGSGLVLELSAHEFATLAPFVQNLLFLHPGCLGFTAHSGYNTLDADFPTRTKQEKRDIIDQAEEDEWQKQHLKALERSYTSLEDLAHCQKFRDLHLHGVRLIDFFFRTTVEYSTTKIFNTGTLMDTDGNRMKISFEDVPQTKNIAATLFQSVFKPIAIDSCDLTIVKDNYRAKTPAWSVCNKTISNFSEVKEYDDKSCKFPVLLDWSPSDKDEYLQLPVVVRVLGQDFHGPFTILSFRCAFATIHMKVWHEETNSNYDHIAEMLEQCEPGQWMLATHLFWRADIEEFSNGWSSWGQITPTTRKQMLDLGVDKAAFALKKEPEFNVSLVQKALRPGHRRGPQAFAFLPRVGQ